MTTKKETVSKPVEPVEVEPVKAEPVEGELTEGIGLPDGFTAVDYVPPGLQAAEDTVAALERELEVAKAAVEAQKKIQVDDVVAEQAARRIEAANSDEEKEQIKAAEAIRLSTEAKVQTNDPELNKAPEPNPDK